MIMRLIAGCLLFLTMSLPAAPAPLSPAALTVSPDGKRLYVACATANRVLCFDVVNRTNLHSISMPESPTGLTISSNGAQLFVTCAAPESTVCVVDTARATVVKNIAAGHTAMDPVLAPDGRTLYVCNRFNNDVGVIDLATGRETRRIAVQREPFSEAITPDGKFLLVANHLPHGRSDSNYVAAVVSVIDLAEGRVTKEVPLPNGSSSLKNIRISPDGKYAAVVHVSSRFLQPTTNILLGEINGNGLSIIDLGRMELAGAVLLDDPDKGAANPWGLAWSADGQLLLVTHAGTHNANVIRFPELLAQLTKNPRKSGNASGMLSRKLPFTQNPPRHVGLATNDFGPRSVVVAGRTAYIANYFSDTLTVIDLSAQRLKAVSLPLGPQPEMDLVRKGEFYFNDAGICLQGWQTCYSCHPGDARDDGLNWDLPNDGLGNPKNNKSLLLVGQTPPSMSLGVRANADAAIRAGIKGTLCSDQPDEIPTAILAYLESLKPVPSPRLVNGRLSPAAERGQAVFREAECARCHPPGLFTNLRSYDVGTRRSTDKPNDKFDTPTLVELWRTAPYLHDGSAATVREVLTTYNSLDQHGVTSILSDEAINDLCEYLLSL